MTSASTIKTNWLHLLSGGILTICYFLPWANWDGSIINGFNLASGKFFSISESRFGLGNPYPQLNFSFYVFWLIPVLALIALVFAARNKKNSWPAMIAGAMTLALFAVFYLFTKTLTDLGVGSTVFAMLKIPAWLAAVSAIVLVISAGRPVSLLKKTGWIIAGPLFALVGFMIIEKKVWGEKFGDTKKAKADFTVTADALLREFAANDSAANLKFREKIIEVNGNTSKVELLSDSTSSIQFADSVGSYLIFSFDKDHYVKVKNIKEGDAVTLKGSCSGSIHSQILGTTSISFKRSTINKK